MYSMLIDSICKKAGVSVAFLGMDGVPVFFNSKVDPALLTPAGGRGVRRGQTALASHVAATDGLCY